jgi:hypothetical protein
MHILMTLEEYFKRLTYHKDAIDAAYLITARELTKLDYIRFWAPMPMMWSALRVLVYEGGLELALANQFVDTRMVKKVRQLLLALMGDFDNFPRTSQQVNNGLLATVSEVKSALDMPLIFARDEDLLNHTFWFAGEMESPCYVEEREVINSEQEWGNLVSRYPHGPYMWRADWDAIVPSADAWYHKNIMILDVEAERERFEALFKE